MSRPFPPRRIVGTARVGRRTKDLVKELRTGEIAVIDHLDLDRVAAEALLEAGVSAVVNAAASISGRYPNMGPLLLAAAGIPIIDNVGSEVMEAISDGERLTIDDGRLVTAGWSGVGDRQTLLTLEDRIAKAKDAMGEELERFATNTLEYLREERHLIIDPPQPPDVGIAFADRHALVVVRGADYREDLAALKRGGYLSEQRPVLIGVDGGADALLDLGHRPDVIVGDMDSVSQKALHCGAKLVVHAYPGGKAPGADRLIEAGLAHHVFEAPGTSEDIAMLMAFEAGASLIVAVGTHNSMVEFLDKGRAGMASTLLVRMKIGPILVDAKGVSRLYESRVRKRDMLALVASALVTLLVVTAVSQPAKLFLESLWLSIR